MQGRGAKEDHNKILCNQLATTKSSPIISNTKVCRWYNECSSNVQPLGVVTETAWLLFACASYLKNGHISQALLTVSEKTVADGALQVS
jgi:hypothetical protein